MELISMTCRNCGGKLQINKEADQILCENCGTEYLVSFHEGAISLKLLSQGIDKISKSTDKTAAELALARIRKEKDLLIISFSNIINSLSTEKAKSLITNQVDGITRGVKVFDPTRYKTKCESILLEEENSFMLFRNPDYLGDLKILLEYFKKLENQYLDIVKQEEYYLGIVREQ